MNCRECECWRWLENSDEFDCAWDGIGCKYEGGGKMEEGRLTLDEAIEQLRRVAKRHEGTKGLLHEIADSIEVGIEELRAQASAPRALT